MIRTSTYLKIIVQLCFGDIPQLTTNPNGLESSHFNGSCNPVYVCQASCDLFHHTLLFEYATFKMCYNFVFSLFVTISNFPDVK